MGKMRTLAERRKAMQDMAPTPVKEKEAPIFRPVPKEEVRQEATVVAALVEALEEVGVEQAFGVSGGAIALLFDAIQDSSIELHHFRHESGAAFAATEAHFASGKPALVFATTGPGTLNVLTGLMAARWDGAKVILVSGATSVAQRGRWATQETSSYTLPQDALYTKGPVFDFAVRMEHASEMPEILKRLSLGLARPGGFVAHVCLPMSMQSKRIDLQHVRREVTRQSAPAVTTHDLEMTARLLKPSPFVIWAGFGATASAPLVRELVDRSGAKLICSPRAKGILSELHPNFVGVTGLGGHEDVTEHMVQQRPNWVLVLGTRLGEATSFWDRDLLPAEGFIHVDIDPEVPGTAYPDFKTIGIQAEIGYFLNELLEYFQVRPMPANFKLQAWDSLRESPRDGRSPVRPQVLMDAIQRHVVQGSDAMVMSECGNSFAWCNHYLQFNTSGRYRVSTLFGSMGHMASGVVGAAMATSSKAVAVVGDGSMLMNSEISTAAQYGSPAVWVVLNDSGYGMCRDGHEALGLTSQEVKIPRVDFVSLARSMGANGARVESEEMLDIAFEEAMRSPTPFVIDVHIDTHETSPLLRRFESLIKQGGAKNVAGWEA